MNILYKSRYLGKFKCTWFRFGRIFYSHHPHPNLPSLCQTNKFEKRKVEKFLAELLRMLIHPTWVLRSISFLRFSLFVIRKIRVLGCVESLSLSNWWGLLILSQLCALCYYWRSKDQPKMVSKNTKCSFSFRLLLLFCLAASVLLVGYTHSRAKLSNLLGGII